jgi:hypothetical protein
MKEKVAAPVDTWPDSCAVSAAVWQSRAAPNWNASPPLVPCTAEDRSAPAGTSPAAALLGHDPARTCSEWIASAHQLCRALHHMR